ncbi:MAG: PEP-CTERM system histidine kinase PrsK [Rhodocyclaceae bacterium]|jgi:putative PEP-CTERM system histidine kinase|nr:PEP-CTERM system histidine kinase PrsK [Rhodocyclaceae bacterium]
MLSEIARFSLWSHAVGAVLHLFFTLYLLRVWRGTANGLLIATAVGFGAGMAGCDWAVVAQGPSWLSQLAVVLDVARMGAWFAFLLGLLLSISGALPRQLLWTSVAVVGFELTAVSLVGFELSWIGDPARLAILAFLMGAVWLLVLTEQLFRALPPAGRWAVKPATLGLAAMGLFDLYYFADGFLFGRLDGDAWAVRHLAHALVLPLFALSGARSPDWTPRLSMSRQLVFHTSALAASGLYLLLISGAGYYVRYFGGEWGRALQIALLFGGILLLSVVLFSASQRAKMKVLLSKHLFPYRYDYRVEWLKFTRALAGSQGTQGLGESVVQALADLVESPGGGLWLGGSDGFFRQSARLNMPALEGVEEADGVFARFLLDREWVVNLEDGRGRPGAPVQPELPGWLSAVDGAWLVVPLISGETLVGFVLLLSPRTPFEVDWEVLDLLKTAQRQAASYLARTIAAEALLEARKFEAFNRMSAFVVHDLKNLVAQLSLLLKNAERHKHNPAFQEDMFETVAHVEAKMRELMTQLQEKRSINPPQTVDLGAVLERIQARRRALGQRVEVDLGSRPAVVAHPEKVERVVGHLVQNALEATSGRGKVVAHLDSSDGQVLLKVEDDGCGMTQEFIAERLFKPFESTKGQGMGIGMYEVQQYLHELGGRVTVDSAPGHGTRVELWFPLAGRARVGDKG